MLGRALLHLPRCTTAARTSALRRPLPLPFSCRGSARALHSIGAVDGVHPPLAAHSHGVVVGPGCKTVYLSGQPGIDAEGALNEGGAVQLFFVRVSLRLALLYARSFSARCGRSIVGGSRG